MTVVALVLSIHIIASAGPGDGTPAGDLAGPASPEELGRITYRLMAKTSAILPPPSSPARQRTTRRVTEGLRRYRRMAERMYATGKGCGYGWTGCGTSYVITWGLKYNGDFYGIAGLESWVVNGSWWGVAQIGVIRSMVAGGDFHGMAQVALLGNLVWWGDFHGLVQAGLANGVVIGNFYGAAQIGLANHVSDGNVVALARVGLANTMIQERGAVLVQAGLMNASKDSEAWFGLEVGVLANVHTGSSVFSVLDLALVNYGKDFSGVQAGLLNWAGTLSGVQVGAVNVASTVRGLQIGLYNSADVLYGVQVGVVNNNGAGLRWMPILNVGW